MHRLRQNQLETVHDNVSSLFTERKMLIFSKFLTKYLRDFFFEPIICFVSRLLSNWLSNTGCHTRTEIVYSRLAENLKNNVCALGTIIVNARKQNCLLSYSFICIYSIKYINRMLT